MRASTGIFLYVSARGLQVLRFARGGCRVEAGFAIDDGQGGDAGLPAFAAWVERARPRAVQVLVDTVDEELHLETLPRVRRADRDILIRKRLVQRFGESEFTTWLPYRRGAPHGRRVRGAPVELVIAGLRANATLAPWLDRLLRARVPVTAIHSPALLAPTLGAAVHPGATALVVSCHPAGLRQTLLVDGGARFSRLASAPGRVDAAAVGAEVQRTFQYLLMSQLISRDAMREGAIRVWVVDNAIEDPGALPARFVVDAASSVEVLRIDPHDLAPAIDATAPAYALWAVLAARLGRAGHYGNARTGRFARLASVRRAILGLSAGALAAAGLAAIGVDLYLSGTRPALRALEASAALARAQGERLKAEIDSGSLSAPEMQAVVEIAARVAHRHVDSARVLTLVAKAFEPDERLTLDALAWSVAAPAGSGAAGAPPSPGAAPLPPPVPGALPASGASPPHGAGESSPAPALEVEVLARGHVSSSLGKTAANAAVREFADRLRAACACSVQAKRLPYDPAPGAGWSQRLDDATQAGGPLEFRVEARLPQPGAAATAVPSTGRPRAGASADGASDDASAT